MGRMRQGGRHAEIAGFATPAVRWMVVGIWVMIAVHTALIGAIGEHPWIVGSLAAGALGAVVYLCSDDPLRPRASVTLVLCEVASGTAVFAWSYPSHDLWAYVSASLLAGAQIARGDRLAGAIGALLVCVTGMLWGVLLRADSAQMLTILLLPISVPIIYLCLSVVMSWHVRRVQQQRSNEARARVAETVANDAHRETLAALARIKADVGPVLERLRAGVALDASVRAEIEQLEAAIRDRIRSPRLQHPQLAEAIGERRRAGASILVLGESHDVTAQPLQPELVAALSAHIAQVPADATATVRTVPGAVASADAVVTVVVSNAQGTRSAAFDAAGGAVRRE